MTISWDSDDEDTGSLLWDEVTSWTNLMVAYGRAAKGKRGRWAAAAFEKRLADNLLILQSDLQAKRYRPGAYRHFAIYRPKRRKISAAPFRDRVVHHALCNVIEPLFEQRFHPHSYANRVGMGTHRAIDRLQDLAARHRLVLRVDVRQHFASIDHAVLRAELGRVVGDPHMLWLIDRILESGDGVLRDQYTPMLFPGDDLLATLRPRGLPIGNLSSQFWSNCYLNPFDWFVARELGCAAYVRYVDDFALFSDDKDQLWAWHRAIVQRLARLRLTLHPHAHVMPVEQGTPWLGFIVFPEHRRVKHRNVVDFRRRLAAAMAHYRSGRTSFAHLDASVRGWINHVSHGDTYGLRRRELGSAPPIRAPRPTRPATPDEQPMPPKTARV